MQLFELGFSLIKHGDDLLVHALPERRLRFFALCKFRLRLRRGTLLEIIITSGLTKQRALARDPLMFFLKIIEMRLGILRFVFMARDLILELLHFQPVFLRCGFEFRLALKQLRDFDIARSDTRAPVFKLSCDDVVFTLLLRHGRLHSLDFGSQLRDGGGAFVDLLIERRAFRNRSFFLDPCASDKLFFLFNLRSSFGDCVSRLFQSLFSFFQT